MRDIFLFIQFHRIIVGYVLRQSPHRLYIVSKLHYRLLLVNFFILAACNQIFYKFASSEVFVKASGGV